MADKQIPPALITDEMVSATACIEAAARTWQAHHRYAKPACFLTAMARFLARSFAPATDATFDALVVTMREERADWQARRVIRG